MIRWTASRHPDSRCCMRAEIAGVALRARDLGPLTVPLDAVPWEVVAWPARMQWSRARDRGKLVTVTTTRSELNRAAARAVAASVIGCEPDAVVGVVP